VSPLTLSPLALPLPESRTLVLFVVAALVLLLTPGPAVLYIVARGVHQGRTAGVVSALAVGLGNLVHALAATLGLSALLLSSALAFAVVKYLGAAYLIFIGVRTLLARGDHTAIDAPKPRALRRIFGQGFVVAVLNPKTALFFFAFLPQFVDPARGAVPLQFLLFGSLFAALGVCSDSAYGLLAGTLSRWLRRSAASLRRGRYVTGTGYIGRGLTAAVAEPQR
jgi:threonine/homoserine/homoserine lactone efflux protein